VLDFGGERGIQTLDLGIMSAEVAPLPDSRNLFIVATRRERREDRSIGIVRPTMMLNRPPALRTEFALICGID
jgi:hypothetical protein